MRTGKLIAVCLLMLVSSALLMTAGMATTTGQGTNDPAAAQAVPLPDTGDASLSASGEIGNLGDSVYAATPDGVRGSSDLPAALMYLALILAAIDLAVALFVLVFGTRPWIVVAMTVVVTFSVIQLLGTVVSHADDLHKLSSSVAFAVSLLCLVMVRNAERDRPKRRAIQADIPAMQFHQRKPRESAPAARPAAPLPGHDTRLRKLGPMGPDGVGGHIDVPGGSYMIRVEGASHNVELAVCDDGGHWLALPKPDPRDGRVQVHLASGRFYLVARDPSCPGSMVSVAMWDAAPAQVPAAAPTPGAATSAQASPMQAPAAPAAPAFLPVSAMGPVQAPAQPQMQYPQAYPQPQAYAQPQQAYAQPQQAYAQPQPVVQQQPQLSMEQWQAGMSGMAGQQPMLQPAFRPAA